MDFCLIYRHLISILVLANNFSPMHYCALSAEHKTAIFKHLTELPEVDRHCRFHALISERSIQYYVNQFKFDSDIVIGCFNGDKLIGLCHIACDGIEWHLGLSVLPELTGRGVGQTLLNLGLISAKEKGIDAVLAECLIHNKAMRHMCEKNGWDIVLEGCGSCKSCIKT